MNKVLASLLSAFLLALACSDDDESDGGGGSGGSAGSGNEAGSAGSGTTAGSGGAAGDGAGGAAGSGQSGAGGGMSGSSGSAGDVDAGDDPDASGGGDTTADGTMTFFVTSDGIGNGGDLGGLTGADAFCRQLAVAVDAALGRRTWRAYLSTTEEDARDRIGTGPWHNQAGEIIANDLTQLHDQGMTGTLNDTWPIADLTVALDEEGGQVMNGVHDILTGTQADGTLDEGLTCEDWTSDADDEAIEARVGHSNRTGGGQPPSWSTTHTVGCSQDGANNITQGGGRGSIYCFAVIDGD